MELNFSIIGEPTPGLKALLAQFERQQSVRVELWEMSWDNAWEKLLSFALHGQGPEISHIGSTWGGSLTAMNVLRPFSKHDLAGIGGPGIFLPGSWASACLPGDDTVAVNTTAWSLPWTAYVFLVYYRLDLFQQAGVAIDQALSSGSGLLSAVEQLARSGIESPCILPSGSGFLDRVHIASSWIWGAGGDLVSADNRRVTFNQPAARRGLAEFFGLYQRMYPADWSLNFDESVARFQQGRTALVVAGADLGAYLDAAPDPAVRAHWRAAPLPGIPWMGGDNLVIWKDALLHPERERAALALAQFLTSRPAQNAYSKVLDQLPVRADALAGFPDHPDIAGSGEFRQVIVQALQRGRAQREIRLWGRIEHQLGQALDLLTADVLAEPGANLERLFDRRLASLEERLNIMLS